METNPRIQNEWAPPPPIATPPPPPPLKPTPTTEEEFEGLLGNLVEHYSALPPPSFGESPVADEKTDVSVRVGPPAWVWAISSVVVVGIAGAALFLTGVVNLEMLGLKKAIKTTAPAPAISIEDVAKEVKIRVAPPQVEPLPTTEPLASDEATDVEPAAPGIEKEKKVKTDKTNKPPVATVKVKVKKARPRGVAKRVKQSTKRRSKRVSRAGADDWTDPYQ
jgi:hypothetical protein